MSTADGDLKKSKGFTESQKASAYFNMDDGYDPKVYENTWGDIGIIIGMLIIFYIFQGFHWWANFELGVHKVEISTYYNLIIFGTAVIVIGGMLVVGAGVNKKKMCHEFYVEKIAAEKLRLQEEQEKAAQKAVNEAKLAQQMKSMAIN